MVQVILFLLTMLCTNPAPHTPGGPKCNGVHIIRLDGDTGGETGNPPPPPPPPPPPRG